MEHKIPDPADLSGPQAAPSRLQSGLLRRILELMRADAAPPGSRISELRLARTLQVSRTPVRAALGHLAQRGVVHRAARGFVTGTPEAAGQLREVLGATPDEALDLMRRLASDRRAGLVPPEVSEADLERRYRPGRTVLHRALARLAGLGVVERKAGHGWTFAPMLDRQGREESLRWRMLVECGALLEPGFRLDPAWIAAMRERHERVLRSPWDAGASIPFLEMNAGFHEGLAAGAGNRHVLLAVQQQNSLRRLVNYDWGFDAEQATAARRVRESTEEHLAILAHAEAGEAEVASALMRRHLARVLAMRQPSCTLLMQETS